MAHKTHAAEPHTAAPKQLSLPVEIISPVEIGRLLSEMERIDDALLQLGLRHGGATPEKMPKTTRLMDQLTEANGLNFLKAEDRKRGLEFLALVREKAPVLQMSFSSDPPPAFTEKLMAWLRREIHPLVLLSVGLQPNLGAGCVLYGSSKYFDLSLKQTFVRQRQLLINRLLAPEKAA